MSFRHLLLISTLSIFPVIAPSAALAGSNSSAPTSSLQQAELTELAPREIGMGDARDGSLLFKTDTPGRYIKAPSVKTDVDISIAGLVIRTTLSQTFQNDSDDWVEGIYVFPLPENAAVDRLRMVIGGRLIEGLSLIHI